MGISIARAAHRAYLNSSKWDKIRYAALNHYGRVCAKCGGFGKDVHHKCYPEIQGEEKMKDLQVLCRSCHNAVHMAERALDYNNALHVQALFSYLTGSQVDIITSKLNLQYPLYSAMISDSKDGEDARQMAMQMLGIHRYYGLKTQAKPNNEKYITAKESKRRQAEKLKAQQDSQRNKQRAWKKNLQESNPRLYGFNKPKVNK